MKKIIGVISSVLFIVIAFQSCAAGFVNTVNNNKVASGSAGIMLALCMLIAGILSLLSKNSKSITLAAIVFYLFGGLVGIANVGVFADLQIWSALSLIFGALLVWHLKKHKDLYQKKIEQ